MFKRVRWMSIGAIAGLGGSVWAQRQVRRTVQRLPESAVHLPEAAAGQVARRARNWRDDLRDAVAEGRAAMVDREDELRAQLRVPERREAADDQPLALPTGPVREGPQPWAEIIDVDERRAGRSEPAEPPLRRHRPARRRRSD